MTTKPEFTMRSRGKPLLFALAVSVILTAIALWLGILTQPLARGPVLVYFLAPVVISTWLSGAPAGLLTLGLDFLCAWYVLAEPHFSFRLVGSEDRIHLGSMLIVGLVIVYVIARLRVAEQRHRELSAIVEFSDDAIIRQTLDGIITTWNRGAERLYGYTADEVLGRSLSILNPSETADELRIDLERLSHGEHIQHYEASRKCKDGRLVDVEVKISPVFDDAGRVSGASRLAHDVTARKQAQEALRGSEQRLQLLIEHAPAGLAMFDRNMRYLYASERWRNDYGIKDRDVRGLSHYELFPEIPDRWKEAHRLGLAGEVIGSDSDRFDRADGSTQWVRWQIRPWRDQAGEVGGIVIFAEEITEREEAHQRLRESERRLQFAITATADAVWEWKPKTGETYYSPRWYEMLGYSHKQFAMTFEAWKSLCHPQDLQAALKHVRSALATGIEYRAEFRMRHQDGSWRWILGRGNVVERDPSGNPVLVSGTNSDITTQKRAEELRRESEQRFRAMAENIPQMVWVANANGRFSYLSPKWLAYTGTTLEQNVDGGWIDVVHPDDRAAAAEVWAHATETGSRYETEYRLRRVDGQYRWHLARGVPLYDANLNETLWFGTTTDIEDKKRATDALIRSEKLASVGRMAATVAHEINNPLAAAINAIYIARTFDERSEQAKSVLAMAEQELVRASQITKQTLGFYRESSEPRPLDAAAVLNQIVDLYHNKVRNKSIRIERRFKEGVIAFAVEGEIRQVLSNLIANAIDAVPAGGMIRIRLSETGSIGARMVRITIADNGAGIAPDNMGRIFEPFFTTKESYGTGLGLWISRELLTKQRGRIRVRSSLGKGTTFSVWLPMETRIAQRRREAA